MPEFIETAKAPPSSSPIPAKPSLASVSAVSCQLPGGMAVGQTLSAVDRVIATFSQQTS